MTSFQLAGRKIQQDTTKIQLAKTPCNSDMSHIRIAMVTIQLVTIKRQDAMTNTYLLPPHCRLKMTSIQFAMGTIQQDTTKIQLAKTHCGSVMSDIPGTGVFFVISHKNIIFIINSSCLLFLLCTEEVSHF